MPITKEHREKLSLGKSIKFNSRTHCKHGHLWIEQNIKIEKNGKKSCILCDRIFGRINAAKRNKTVKGKISKKNTALKLTYGITIEDYNQFLENQNNKCAICNRDQSEFTRKFAVDHCHITDKIRGLLCGNCNVGIGNLQDDIEILKNAIKYLENGN